MSSRQGEMSPAAPPLEDENLLAEILLRLPPLPSSLPRASAVCKPWRSLASDPAFSRRFRRHHRRSPPPILGCFHGGFEGLFFDPTLESPNRLPPGRFSLQLDAGDSFVPLGCRHGLVLLLGWDRRRFLVWNPFTGDRHRIDMPPGFDPAKTLVNGAVLRSDAGDSQHFEVVLVVADNKDELNSRILACVYLSETGVWGDLISTPIAYGTQVLMQPAVHVGDSLHWLLGGGISIDILEFDLERQRLAVIQMPIFEDVPCFTVMRPEGGGLGFLSVSGFNAQLWKRKTDSDGVASWEMRTTIELDDLLSLDSKEYPAVQGFAEDNNLVYLRTFFSLFTLHLDSLQTKELPKDGPLYHYHPFESVYAAGI